MTTEGSYLFETGDNQILVSKEVDKQDDDDDSVDKSSIWKPDWRLVPSKIFYFSFLSSIAVSIPYSSVFMKQLGMSAFRIGVISGIRPFLGFVSGICWGMLADKYRIWRWMLLSSIFFWGLFFVLFYNISDPERKSSCHNSSDNSSSLSFNPSNENISWLYEENSLTKTFIFCILCICVGELLQSPTGTMGDTLTLKVLGPDGVHKYGWQRSWGAAGMAINSFLAGYLLSLQRWTETMCGVVIHFSNYRILSILVSIFSSICFINSMFLGSKCVQKSTNEDEEPTKRLSLFAVLKLFGTVHYGSWLAGVFYMGYCNGTIWGFVFWHLDNLGASQLLMGIDSLCTNIVEILAYCMASYMIEKISHTGVLIVSLFMYSIRFALYAALTDPWWVIPIDIMQGITFSISWISITAYTTLMVPSESLATIQGIVHGVLFGLGNGLGHLISGIFIEYYGAVCTFYGMAIASFVFFVIFLICQVMGEKPAAKIAVIEE